MKKKEIKITKKQWKEFDDNFDNVKKVEILSSFRKCEKEEADISTIKGNYFKLVSKTIKSITK